jgi:hypothetical protein
LVNIKKPASTHKNQLHHTFATDFKILNKIGIEENSFKNWKRVYDNIPPTNFTVSLLRQFINLKTKNGDWCNHPTSNQHYFTSSSQRDNITNLQLTLWSQKSDKEFYYRTDIYYLEDLGQFSQPSKLKLSSLWKRTFVFSSLMNMIIQFNSICEVIVKMSVI